MAEDLLRKVAPSIAAAYRHADWIRESYEVKGMGYKAIHAASEEACGEPISLHGVRTVVRENGWKHSYTTIGRPRKYPPKDTKGTRGPYVTMAMVAPHIPYIQRLRWEGKTLDEIASRVSKRGVKVTVRMLQRLLAGTGVRAASPTANEESLAPYWGEIEGWINTYKALSYMVAKLAEKDVFLSSSYLFHQMARRGLRTKSKKDMLAENIGLVGDLLADGYSYKRIAEHLSRKFDICVSESSVRFAARDNPATMPILMAMKEEKKWRSQNRRS